MRIESLLVLLLVGAVAGWLAGQIVRGRGFGLLANLVVGVKVDVKGQLASTGTVVVAQEVEFDN